MPDIRYVVADTAEEAVFALLGPGVEVAHRCPECGSLDHGRPSVNGHSISIARAGERAVVAIGPEGAALGVDLESRTRLARAPIEDAVLHESERDAAGDPEALLRLWTGKEALLKARGRGLRDDPRGIELDRSRVEYVEVDDDLLLAIYCE